MKKQNNITFLTNIHDLNEYQYASFYNFLKQSLAKQIAKIPNPFRNKSDCLLTIINEFNSKLNLELNRLYFFSSEIKFINKETNVNEINNLLISKKTNLIEIHLPFDLIKNNDNKDIIIRKSLYLGEIPMMTSDGTFIVEGTERIIINNIVRCPGIYFFRHFKNNNLYNVATIISKYGICSRIEYCQILNEKNFADKEKFLFTLLLNNSILELFNSLNIDKYTNNLSLLDHNSFFLLESLKKISLGEFGRRNFNKGLNINIPYYIENLTIHDIIKTFLILSNNKFEIDDIDHVKNKRILSIGAILNNLLECSITELCNDYYSNNNRNLNKEPLNNNTTKLFNKKELKIKNILKDSFACILLGQISQFLDNSNPLSEISHKRRINVKGETNYTASSSSIRNVHPSQHGRICPIDSVEGENAGLVISFSSFARINKNGEIKSPYFISINPKLPILLSSFEESKINVALSNKIFFKFNNLNKNYLLGKKDYKFSLINVDKHYFEPLSPFQFFSIAIALQPFFEHNDATRVQMSSSMQRQAVPLIFPKYPIVGTNMETIISSSSNFNIKSYSEGYTLFSSSSKLEICDYFNQKINYILKKNNFSNQKTYINQRPTIWAGEKVFLGQIIAYGSGFLDAELALGQNFTIAYMPWEGYNYEDSIVISEKLIINDSLTSVHISEINIELDYLYNNSLLPKFSHIYNLDKYGIIKIGSYVSPYDVLFMYRELNEQNNLEDNFRKDIYNNIIIDNIEQTKIIYIPHNINGRIININVIEEEFKKEEKIIIKKYLKFYIAQLKKIKVGDKLSGRHGNKGIISKILPIIDMPSLSDGTKIDIILNPLGVPSRMNIGQILESMLGLIGSKVKKRFKNIIFDEIHGNESSRILINQKLKEISLNKTKNWLYSLNSFGKVLLKDDKYGYWYDNEILVGKSYIIKLIHIASDKIHARSYGPYNKLLNQPTKGKKKKGGQRFGEMETWALEAHGCLSSLQEILSAKSDSNYNRRIAMQNLEDYKLKYNNLVYDIPESFLIFLRELNAIGISLDFFKIYMANNFNNKVYKNQIDAFKKTESNLRLINFL